MRVVNHLRENSYIKYVAPADPRLLVVSDHPLVAAGFKVLLDLPATNRITVIHSLKDGLAIACKSQWDLVILDLSSSKDWRAALTPFVNCSPRLPILVTSEIPEKQIARSVLKAGARGYFHKSGSAAALRTAVQTVLIGKRYVGEGLAEQLTLDANFDWRTAPHERLSGRELEVFNRIASGVSMSQIGRDMYLSVKTVSTYRARILLKMGLSSNAELVAYAIRNGLRG